MALCLNSSNLPPGVLSMLVERFMIGDRARVDLTWSTIACTHLSQKTEEVNTVRMVVNLLRSELDDIDDFILPTRMGFHLNTHWDSRSQCVGNDVD